ncbi:hypothetical protein [Pseudonocardia sp. NPDC049154]|uniref:hypothetical protein n=1 Tax=Pseudonocardia sp. NPDC049154 TaxID=3155501 RepID=UPI0033FD47BA
MTTRHDDRDTDLLDGVVDDRKETTDATETRTVSDVAAEGEDGLTGEGGNAASTRTGLGARLGALTRPLRVAAAQPARLWSGYRALLRRRPRAVLVAAGAVALVMLALASTGAFLLHKDLSAVADRDAARATAVRTVPQLLSYEPASVDGMLDRLGADLTDGFRQDYGTLITQVVAPAAKSQQITTKAEVTSSSVELDSQAADEVTALLFVNQTTQAPAAASPAQSGSRVRVVMDRVDGRWLVADLKPI